jgi:hypothetical protein
VWVGGSAASGVFLWCPFRIAPTAVSFVGVGVRCSDHVHPFSNCDKGENEKSKRDGKKFIIEFSFYVSGKEKVIAK